MDQSVVPGMYGKLPVLGDFVTRRLPTGFVRAWDNWIQLAMAASREQLQDGWLDVYLTSPIWRFILSPGNCGEKALAGILMPSVDKVGRYFPLTLAAMLDQQEALAYLFVTAADWFDALEQLALSGLEDDIDLEEFDNRLQQQRLGTPAPPEQMQGLAPNPPDDALLIHMQSLQQIQAAYIEMGICLLPRFFPVYSLWSTSGSQRVKPSLLAYKGLPPAQAFSFLLTGSGRQCRQAPQTAQDMPGVAAGAPTPLAWRSHGRSSAGKVRRINEDAFLENPRAGLWAVADGMGGHAAGDEASKAVVEALGSICFGDTFDAMLGQVTDCLQQTNSRLIRLAQERNQGQIMGSTVVVLLAAGNQCASIWAGDCRLYRCRGGLLSQLTRDHAPAPEKLEAQASPSEGAGDPAHSNIVTRALGAVDELDLEVSTFTARPEDIYLLCSDGLIKEVAAREIAEILPRGGCDESSKYLMDLALERGARDNVTVVVARAAEITTGDTGKVEG